MSTRYPGGFINRSAPVIVGPVDGEGGSAPGVWTLEQASYYTKQGTWPQRIKDKPLFGWGWNAYGQVGDGTIISRSSPVQVGSLTTWKNIAAGYALALATKTDGTLWAWGQNSGGQLGQNNTIDYSSPVQIGSLTTWLQVSAAGYSSAAIKSDGTLWTWGRNSYGNLGHNDRVYKSSPTQVGSLSTWSSIQCWGLMSSAIKSDGTLWTWGYNVYGAVGDNSIINRSSPVQVGSLTTWLQSACTFYHTLATKTDGTLWSWGRNNTGQLGQNIAVSINRSSPVQVGALTTWSKVAVYQYGSIAQKSDGTLWTWGDNQQGQLGQNISISISRSSPVQVGSLTTWLNISGGYNHCIATQSDGTLWSWGQNNNGQLGQNNTTYRSSPVQVGALTTWHKPASGGYTTLALQSI